MKIALRIPALSSRHSFRLVIASERWGFRLVASLLRYSLRYVSGVRGTSEQRAHSVPALLPAVHTYYLVRFAGSEHMRLT